MLDVATPGPADYLRHLRPVLPETDVFLPNTDEAALILGETDPVRQAEAFRDLGARRVVITCGDRGAVAVSDALRVRLGTYPVAFVDGSGGGDAFDAGYIAGLLDGLPELDCLKLASAVGASCVRAVGTTAGIFTRPEADAFIRRPRAGRRDALTQARVETSAGPPRWHGGTAHRLTLVLASPDSPRLRPARRGPGGRPGGRPRRRPRGGRSAGSGTVGRAPVCGAGAARCQV